ncbi:hypothetical protein AB0H03_06905 [Streptomyces sparsogenes]|uniref:hypothetical protein n=1 Tax=Streptomyces sparsogenes TaxID=67365 RepID=UPI0033FAF347
MDDDDLLAQIGNLGAAINASRDPNLDPGLQDMAGSAAEARADQLADEHNRRG